MRDSHFDAIVVGGGPAGATTATLLAQRGHEVLLLEREKFPRFRIGESLMPGTYWTFQRLGMLDKLKDSEFTRKYSVQFVSKDGKATRPFYFQSNDPHESSVTWQVLRSEFDQLMLENAKSQGVTVQQGVSVRDILFEGDRASGVSCSQNGEMAKELFARVIVDATGQSALLSRKLELQQPEPQLRKAAIYTHYKGAQRDEGIDEGATIVLHTRDENSWFWYIPLPNDVVSVGVVGDIDYLLQNRSAEAQQIFEEEIELCAAVKDRIAAAHQLFPVKVTKEFSYRARQIAGNGWVLVGDAFGFLDPIYSSGVFLALKSGEMAADTIHQALQENDLSAAALGRFGPQLVEGMEAIRKLVYAFYARDFSFGKFLRRYPDCEGQLINLLIGNVFREGFNGIFQAMREMVELPPDAPLLVGDMSAGVTTQ